MELETDGRRMGRHVETVGCGHQSMIEAAGTGGGPAGGGLESRTVSRHIFGTGAG